MAVTIVLRIVSFAGNWPQDNDYLVLKLEANGIDQRGEVVHTCKAARNLGNHQLTPARTINVTG